VSFADRHALAQSDATFRARISMATVQRALATAPSDSADLITLGVFVLAGQSAELGEMLTRVGLAVLANPAVDPGSDAQVVTELAAIWPKLAFSFARSGRRGANPSPAAGPLAGPMTAAGPEPGPDAGPDAGPPARADGEEQPIGPPPELRIVTAEEATRAINEEGAHR
jgi:hypothetical protein